MWRFSRELIGADLTPFLRMARVQLETRLTACRDGDAAVLRPYKGLEEDLIYAEEVWPEVGRGRNSAERVDVGDFHLRFQRTLPSLLSSRIIP
jgi:hypothetical protein